MKCVAFMTGLAALAGSAMAQGIPGSGLVVLNQTASGALRMTGQSQVRVPAHAVYVNSSSATAVTTQGQATLDTPNLYIVGGASFTGNSGCTGAVCQGGAPYQDPCAGLMFPTAQGMTDYGAKSVSGGGNVTLQPGYYSGGISVTGNGMVMFNAGTYVIGGMGLKVTSGIIFGNNVTIVMQSGSFDIAGASGFNFSPPVTGPYAGMTFIQPASNTSQMKFAGGSDTYVTGTIYAPTANVRLVGNSTLAGEGPQWGDLVVADTVELTGTALIKIGRENLQAITLPKLPLFD